MNDRTDIYVESKLGEVNYLNIFESGGTQIANITYNGFVVYYGFKDIFIYNDETGQYFRMRIQRPIFTIFASNSTEATTFSTINITLPC